MLNTMASSMASEMSAEWDSFSCRSNHSQWNNAGSDCDLQEFEAFPHSHHKAALDEAAGGDLQALQALLAEHPGAIRARDERGQNLAHLAAWYGHVEVLALVSQLDYTLLYDQDNTHQTPAHLAGWNGHQSILRFLHACDPDLLNRTNLYGSTVAHLAAMGGKPDVIQVLYELAPQLWGCRNSQGRLPGDLYSGDLLAESTEMRALLSGMQQMTCAGRHL